MNDNFDLAAFTPSSINEAYDMCVDKKLQPKKSNEIDYYLENINLDENIEFEFIENSGYKL